MGYKIVAWNVRTVLKVATLKSLIPQLLNCNVKLAAIQETGWIGGD